MNALTKKETIDFIIRKSEELGITSNQYEDHTEISNMTAYNILKRISKNPRPHNIRAMLEYIEEKEVGTDLQGNEKIRTLAVPEKTKNSNTKNGKVVPYYNVEIISLDISSFKEAEGNIEFYIDFKPLEDCNAFVPYYSDTMSPTFNSGNQLALKQINNFDIILYGQPHYIITSAEANSYKTVRCVHQHPESDKLILRATNPKYLGDIVIEKKHIRSLYLIKGRVELNEG